MMSINFNDGLRANPLGLIKPDDNFLSFATTGYQKGRDAYPLDVDFSDPNAPRPPQMFQNNMSDLSKRMLPCKPDVKLYNNQRVKRRPPVKVKLYPPNVFSRDNQKGIAVEKEQKVHKILPAPSSFNSALYSTLGATD